MSQAENELFDNETITQEITRDITSFGNISILLLLVFATLGPNLTSVKIATFILLTELIGSMIKLLFYKDRPIKRKHSNLFERLNAASFPSLHSARSTIALLALFSITNHQLKYIFLLAIPAVLISRILLKKHDHADVIAGFLLGLLMFMVYLNV